MWNYNLILPELVIAATFFTYYFSQPKLPLRIKRAFIYILITDTLTLLVDVLSSYCLEFHPELPNFVLRIQNVVFFVLFFQRIICFMVFTSIVLKRDIRKKPRRRIFLLYPFFFCLAMAIINLIKDTLFSISPNGEYSQGPLYFILYICSFYYAFISILNIIRLRKDISRWDFYSSLAFNIVLLIGYFLRIIYPRYLIMNFFTLVAIIIIYLSFENPSLVTDEKSGIFNKKALKLLINEMNLETYPVIIGFSIHTYKDLREINGNNQTDKGLALIGSFLKQTFPKCLSFYIHGGNFVLIAKKIEDAAYIQKKIQERFDQPWTTQKNAELFFEINCLQLNTKLFFNNRELLYTTLTTSLTNLEDDSRSYVVIDIEDIKKIEENTMIKRVVETAVDQNKVELFLQPVIDAKSQKLIGAEALARLRDFNGNIIPPAQFIPIAEKNGRISMLGEQMFEKTCQFIKENDIEKLGLSWINVNLSPIQFLRRDLTKRYNLLLEKYQISSEKIHLEITEESMIDFDLLQSQMQNMKEYGFQFVLDDYGRGYSNVARMKTCPFINIKLDMEFVWDYFKCKDKILPTMVQTIKQMGFSVTAEGIESLEMAEALRDIGCDNLQGFYFSKPISEKDFVEKYGNNKA